MSPSEQPQFFGPDGARLFGVFHAPAGPPRVPFVFCHPFGEEKLWAHRVHVSLARQLAGRGHPVLRVDCRGNGDSDGEFRQTSLASNLDDLDVAIDWLEAQTGTSSVALFGLRFGATEAALAAERRRDVSSLVLWQPIVDGARYMQELLRINLTTQLAVSGAVTSDREALVASMRAGEAVNVDGYDMALPLFDQASAVKLAAAPRAFPGPVLIVQLDRAADAAPARELDALRGCYPQAELRVVQSDPFWKEIPAFHAAATQATAATLDWLERR